MQWVKDKQLETIAPNKDTTKSVDDPKDITKKEEDERVISRKRSLQLSYMAKNFDKDSDVPGRIMSSNWLVLAEALAYVFSGWKLGLARQPTLLFKK